VKVGADVSVRGLPGKPVMMMYLFNKEKEKLQQQFKLPKLF
jgi:hypothetical protein